MFKNRILQYFVLGILLLSSLFGIVLVQEYVGHAVHQSEAGVITELLIENTWQTDLWFGVFGVALMVPAYSEAMYNIGSPGTISEKVLLFPCLAPYKRHKVFASFTPEGDLDWTTLAAYAPADLDAYFGADSSAGDSAVNTFTSSMDVEVGNTEINNVSSTYTYVYENSTAITFDLGALNVSGEPVFVTHIANFTRGYKNLTDNYQMIIPIGNQTRTIYYFADPFDECPAGYGFGYTGDGRIEGYVTEEETGNFLANTTVSIGGQEYTTDATGFYNLTVVEGSHSIVAIKTAYDNYVDFVDIIIAETTYHNISMVLATQPIGNGTIYGIVIDNSTQLPLVNVTVSVGGFSDLTDENGFYNLTSYEGQHILAGTKTGYSNHINLIALDPYTPLEYNFTMYEVIPQAELNNGTLRGFVKGNDTGDFLANVTITIAGVYNLTEDSGFYGMSLPVGTHNLVAVHSSYDTYFAEINITADTTTTHNFTMLVLSQLNMLDNGTVYGYVTDNSTDELLGNITVSIYGSSYITNSTGFFNITAPVGSQVIVATGSGYNNYVDFVNVTSGNATLHNVSMAIVPPVTAGVGPGKYSVTGEEAQPVTQRDGIYNIPPRKEHPLKLVEFDISVEKIIKRLRIGNYMETPLILSNYQKSPVSLKFNITGDVAKLMTVSTDEISILAESDEELTLTILGNNAEPGIYEGMFVISGDIEEMIPIYVLLQAKEKLPVEALVVRITVENKNIYTGQELKYRVDLQNMLSEEKYPVTLRHKLVSLQTMEEMFIEQEGLMIHTSFSLIKNFILPFNLTKGDYMLVVDSDYLGYVSTHSTIFTIKEPLYLYAVFGFLPLWLLMLIIVGAALSTFGFLFYKKKKYEKKRYKSAIDTASLPKQGPRSAFVGKLADSSVKTFFDLDQFQVHTLLVGASGSGKTVAAQDLVEEALGKDVAVMVFDPTAQWTGFLRPGKDRYIQSLYPKFGMKKKDAKAFSGNVHQVKNPRELLDIKKFMKPGEINIFVINKLSATDIELFVANAIREVFHANLPESPELRFIMVYDGIQTLLPKFGGSGRVFLQIERAAREFRKWGVGLMLLSQVLSDLPAEVKANINTEVIMRSRDENDMKVIKEEYGEDTLKSIIKSAKGAGMVENAAYNKGKPYFVEFRPPLHSLERLKEEELEKYNKYNEIIDDLDFQIDQLEEEKLDVFDLRLELKMALDKVKSGNFNMVTIYLDGLQPRIAGAWKKLGKQPEKRKIKLVDQDELEAELQKAEADKEKDEELEEEEAEPEEEDSAEEDLSEGVENAKGIISKIEELISQGKKDEAIEKYPELNKAYQELNEDDKKEIIGNCISIQKELAKNV